VRLWTAIPRGARDRISGVLPEWWWVWLRQLREVEADRRWNAGQLLLQAYPKLAAERAPLNRAEARVYSQNGEDGILAFLFARIGATSRTFVEFGVGDGSECNTANLSITFGWRGLLMDADPELVERARSFYASRPTSPDVTVVTARVTPETIDELLRTNGVTGEIDLLSLDIDGNDYWVWQAMTAIEPRVVVVEYNASFGPERSVTVPYRDRFDRYRAHLSGFYHGASLTALTKLADAKGYLLAGCDSRGANAFFLKREAAGAKVDAVTPTAAYFPLWERAHLPVEEQFAQIRHLELIDV
jgi:predicted O-methyltransferase YrrM